MGDATEFDPALLATQLADVDVERRVAAAEKLSQAGKVAAGAAVPLVKACGDTDERVREYAVAALEDLGPPPQDAIASLTALVKEVDPLTAYWAVTLLGRAGQDAETAVAVLADCIDSGADLSVRQRAAWALGKIGPAAKAASEALGRAAGNTDVRLARVAKEAIEAISG